MPPVKIEAPLSLSLCYIDRTFFTNFVDVVNNEMVNNLYMAHSCHKLVDTCWITLTDATTCLIEHDEYYITV